MSAGERYRDSLRSWLPWWLSDRKYSSGKTVGFRAVWVMIAMLDAIADWIVAGLVAPWPGMGTPSALPLISRSRGILRGMGDTDATHGARLRSWLDIWALAGSSVQLAREVQNYLGNSPTVRIVNRAGSWVIIGPDGAVSSVQGDASWHWDDTSNPERAGYWSEMWIIIYATPFAMPALGTWGDGSVWGGDGTGINQTVSRVDYDAVKNIIATWKSAHSKVRAIVWTTDITVCNLAYPDSLPDGQWGNWGTTGAAARVASNRNYTTCRYWEM